MGVKSTLLNGPRGFGGAPLGNRFRNIPEKEALETCAAAWDQGIRYFDTAPFYGASKPERIAEDIAALKVKVPEEFWHELRTQGLVASNAPLPINR